MEIGDKFTGRIFSGQYPLPRRETGTVVAINDHHFTVEYRFERRAEWGGREVRVIRESYWRCRPGDLAGPKRAGHPTGHGSLAQVLRSEPGSWTNIGKKRRKKHAE